MVSVMGTTRKMTAKPAALCATAGSPRSAVGANNGGWEDGQCPPFQPRSPRRSAANARRHRKVVLAYSVACFGMAGCGAEPKEISHPTPDNIPVDGSVIGASDVPTGLAAVALDDWLRVRDQLRRSEVVLTIGKSGEIGDDLEEVFGWVVDAEFDAEGNIFVLDLMAQNVRVFDAAGRFSTKFGGSGEGPGEFRDAWGLEILSDGRIVVSDLGGHLNTFAREGGEYIYAGRLPIPSGVSIREGACQIGHRFFVSVRASENELIHEIPMRPGRVSRSFGKGYGARYDLVQYLLNEGPIGCLGDPAQIVFAFGQLPVLRSYSADSGVELWTAVVTDYLQGEIVENRATGSIAYMSGIKDIAIAVQGVGEKHVLYQTSRGEKAAPDEIKIRSYLVDATSGNGALISTSLPFVLDVTETHILGYRVTGIPRVEVRRFASSIHEGRVQS